MSLDTCDIRIACDVRAASGLTALPDFWLSTAAALGARLHPCDQGLNTQLALALKISTGLPLTWQPCQDVGGRLQLLWGRGRIHVTEA